MLSSSPGVASVLSAGLVVGTAVGSVVGTAVGSEPSVGSVVLCAAAICVQSFVQLLEPALVGVGGHRVADRGGGVAGSLRAALEQRRGGVPTGEVDPVVGTGDRRCGDRAGHLLGHLV